MNRFTRPLIAGIWFYAAAHLFSQEPPLIPRAAVTAGVFVGSSPCGERMRAFFQIPSGDSDPLCWNLTLHRDPKTLVPAGYQLECAYVPASATSIAAKKAITVKREGTWTIAKGTRTNPGAVVIELDKALSLLQVSDNVLHFLESDRTLMVGDGGYSYTLNRLEAAETPGDLALALARPSVSYTNSPLSQGPSVFGVFEGRSPCRGIARELRRPDDAGCIKVKWRITLYQDPETKIPTRYKVEGTLYRGQTREGKWSILRGAHADPDAMIYRLDATSTEPRLDLLKGDNDVLFFLNQDGRPLVGHGDFSYTLNRRSAAPLPLAPNR